MHSALFPAVPLIVVWYMAGLALAARTATVTITAPSPNTTVTPTISVITVTTPISVITDTTPISVITVTTPVSFITITTPTSTTTLTTTITPVSVPVTTTLNADQLAALLSYSSQVTAAEVSDPALLSALSQAGGPIKFDTTAAAAGLYAAAAGSDAGSLVIMSSYRSEVSSFYQSVYEQEASLLKMFASPRSTTTRWRL
ncbi:MAG: hypothetical protein Q9190_004352 [Brigantiaea leucoxantha]